MELQRGDVKIEWVRLGEGYSGDYNPADPEDCELMRFDVYRQVEGNWEIVEDASYCTRFPADASEAEQMAGLECLMNGLYDAVVSGEGVRGLATDFSRISPDWIKADSSKMPLCRRCGKPVCASENPEYKYQCLNCNEDLYSFEVVF